MQGDEGSDLFFVKSGLMEVIRRNRVIRILGKYDFFGERAVLSSPRRTATVRAKVASTCFYLNKSKIPMDVLTAVKPSMRIRIYSQDEVILLKSLRAVKMLGKGMFGDVYLVQDESTAKLYALKAISRRKISHFRLASSLCSEREALSQLEHPMIVRYFGSYKDELKVYFLLEFINGVDLFTGIREIGLLTEGDARFYIGCLILALEYLHDRDVLFRDLKPENVMLDEEGFPKLVDFGSSKWTVGRTYTVAGTPHYMAPEVILGKGYNHSADFWSLGIMLYEFLCGGVPFGEDLEDPYDIYEEVLQGKLIYPAFIEQHFPAQELIEQLLSKNPSVRLGGNITMLKQHPWLRDVEWQSLVLREAMAPFAPGALNIEEDPVAFDRLDSEDDLDTAEERSPPEPEWDRDF